MCGIAGFYSTQNVFSKEELPGMAHSMAHRGPDAEGVFSHLHVGLAHRRLSIVDLNERSNQPMTSRDGNFVISYNGEVYNFQELAVKHNLTLRTHSDTEVILELFAKIGPTCVEEFNGMFAIAIYDKQKEALHIFRDRLGIKPIYYFFDGENFAFASDIKSLFTLDFVRKQKATDLNSVQEFLYLGYIPHPHTIYQNIYKFETGHRAKINRNGLRFFSYWNIESKVKSSTIKNEAEAKENLKILVEASVKRRLISDVPFGTFLSGGIDSSLVTSVAQSLRSDKINTFSIGFKESKFNEAEHAKAVANHLGTNHHEFIVSKRDALDLFPDIVGTYDEPFADCSSIPTMLVSKLARKHVKMTLSGDGGDEQFLGYGFYSWANRLDNPLIKASRFAIPFVLNAMGNRYQRASHLFAYPSNKKKSHIFSQEQYYFSLKELNEFLLPSVNKRDIRMNENLSFVRKMGAAEEQAFFDLQYYLPDDLLVKVDKASMKYGLEARTPLLDHTIVEYSLNIDENLKVKDGVAKYLLKEVLYDYVPRQMFDRPKWGFSIPLNEWLKTELRDLLNQYTSKEIIQSAGFVDYEKVHELKEKFLSGKDYLYNRVWAIVVLHSWWVSNK
ncbi:MAG: asparagine synthase (glutamine-hydrolyzing) [Bacteroidetes bacterium]|nr:asparagine synthase (glutamine-hydrolyzing) [Bacteroidota bacterium]